MDEKRRGRDETERIGDIIAIISVLAILFFSALIVPVLALDRSQSLFSTYDYVTNNTLVSPYGNVSLGRHYVTLFGGNCYIDDYPATMDGDNGKLSPIIGSSNYPFINGPARKYSIFLTAATNLTGVSFPLGNGFSSHYVGAGLGPCAMAYTMDEVKPHIYNAKIYINGVLNFTSGGFDCSNYANISHSTISDCVIDFNSPPVNASGFGNLARVFPAGTEITYQFDTCPRDGSRCLVIETGSNWGSYSFFGYYDLETFTYNDTLTAANHTRKSDTYGFKNFTCAKSGLQSGGTSLISEYWNHLITNRSLNGSDYYAPFDACGRERHNNIVDFSTLPLTYVYWSEMLSNSTNREISLTPAGGSCLSNFLPKYALPVFNYYGVKTTNDTLQRVLETDSDRGYETAPECVNYTTAAVTTTTTITPDACDIYRNNADSSTGPTRTGNTFSYFICKVGKGIVGYLLAIIIFLFLIALLVIVIKTLRKF